MARKINKNSTRQKAFKKLDKLVGTPRKQAVEKIMKDFDVSESYAKTLYQHHRNGLKDNGELKESYRVRDNDGELSIVKTYTGHVFAETPEEAVEAYVADLNVRIGSARQLATPMTNERDELKPYFDAVAPSDDWRDRIDAIIKKEDYDITERAIIYFTGTHIDEVTEVGKDNFRIKAVGYRNGPCGP